jgi:hypothetical protein
MGCFRRIGCAVALIAVCVAGWLTRDRWLPMVGWRSVTASGPTWEPLSDAGAARARAALAKLSQARGPVFANLSGGDVASYVYRELARQLPASTDSVEAAVIGDQLHLRASVRLGELGGSAVLGPFAGMFGDRERVEFGGTFHLVRRGLAEYQIRTIRIRDFAVPAAVIPRIIKQIGRGARPEGLSPDGLPLVVPDYIGDIRITNGKITLYKNVGQ